MTDTRAQEMLERVERLVSETVAPGVTEWDRADELPDAVFDALVEIGLPGAMVPAQYGGLGLTVTELVPIWRALSGGWISLTGAVNPSGLATTLLRRHGSESQRERWLPRLAEGRTIAAFSITEPQAGSDLGRLELTARPAQRGGYVLDGEKRWVAGGATADVVFIMAMVEGSERPSCLILPPQGRAESSWEVFELDKVGYRGVESAAYRLRAHEATAAQLLGGDEGLGRGAGQMLDALDVGRVNVACRALGIADRAVALSLAEAREREIGDGVLGDHTHAQLRIGELRARLLAVEAAALAAARLIDRGSERAADAATAAKLVASENAVWSVDQASRLAASRSYGTDDELARLRRDAPQTQIGEGANDALLLALGRRAISP